MSRALELRGVSARYAPGDPCAVDACDLHIETGELLALVGPSGCGKTTLLRLVAGLEALDAGEIHIGGRCVAEGRQQVPTEQRGVGLVFQEHALFPHRNVWRNVAFGLEIQGAQDARARARAMLRRVGLEHLAERDVHELSGGEQQRVAVARALAVEPRLLLLDEPFNSLDASRRVDLRHEVRALLRETDTSALLVTHDREEALAMADRVAVMHEGRIQQMDTPAAIYAAPRTAFVARFLCRANVLDAQADGTQATCILGTLPLTTAAQGAIQIAVRPEQLALTDDPALGVEAHVTAREYRGATSLLTVRIGDDTLRLVGTTDADTIHVRATDPAAVLNAPA